MSDHEIVESEIVDEHGGELAVRSVAPVSLFGTDAPADTIARATEHAKALDDVIRSRGLFKSIQGRDHILVEGWTLLGAMVGVFPILVWSRRLENPDGWEARVEARTMGGVTVGAAEAQCTRDEKQWSLSPTNKWGKPLEPRDDYALRSMAQTRATSKALRGPLGFIVQLAGYNATPAEEMPDESGTATDTARSSESAAEPPDVWHTEPAGLGALTDELLALADTLGAKEATADAINRNREGHADDLNKHKAWLSRQIRTAKKNVETKAREDAAPKFEPPESVQGQLGDAA